MSGATSHDPADVEVFAKIKRTDGTHQRSSPTPAQEKFDAQKKALQRLVLVLIERGKTTGLSGQEVAALDDALKILGWLPTDVRV